MNILENAFRSLESGSESNLSNPANWLSALWGGTSASGENVTPETSLGLPAIWSAVSLYGQIVGSLPLKVYSTASGSRVLSTNPVGTLLKRKPNDMMTSYQWRQLMMATTLLWGNAYSLIVRATDTRPEELIPFHPNQVSIKKQDGKYWYVLQTDDRQIVVDSSNMLHFKGLGFNGIQGKSVVACERDSIGIGLSSQRTAGTFYKNGMMLDGTISTPNAMKDDALKHLRASWDKTYNGPEGKRVALLDNGMEYKSIGMSPEDSQFIQTRMFQVTEVCRMFRVPPPLLYDLERATFSNIQELILSFVKFSLTPWLVNFEQEMNDKLLREDEKGNVNIEFSVEGLLRGDSTSRADYYQKLIMNGVMNPNEARQKENLNPYPEGDTFVIPQNMQPVGTETETENNN